MYKFEWSQQQSITAMLNLKQSVTFQKQKLMLFKIGLIKKLFNHLGKIQDLHADSAIERISLLE